MGGVVLIGRYLASATLVIAKLQNKRKMSHMKEERADEPTILNGSARPSIDLLRELVLPLRNLDRPVRDVRQRTQLDR